MFRDWNSNIILHISYIQKMFYNILCTPSPGFDAAPTKDILDSNKTLLWFYSMLKLTHIIQYTTKPLFISI